MARTDITVTRLTPGGANPAATVGQVDGHMFAITGKEVLAVENTGAAARTVTLPTPRQIEDLDVEERAISIPAGETHHIGNLDPSVYRQPSGTDRNKAYIDYDPAAPAELSVQVFRLD